MGAVLRTRSAPTPAPLSRKPPARWRCSFDCLFAHQAVMEDYNIDRPLIRQEIVLKPQSVQVIVNFSNYPRVPWLFQRSIDASEPGALLLGVEVE